MKIITSLENINIEEKTSIALGNFDGIHLGHRRIMENAINAAKDNGALSLCFTFSNHPFNFILNRADDDSCAAKLICSESEKIRLIEEMGFDTLVNIPFDESILTMPADLFFDDIVRCRLNAGSVSVGFNYSYGARAGGNPETLREACNAAGIDCNIQEAVRIDGEVVSSTLIREMISEGNMERVAAYFGRAYSFRGRVEHGKRLGTAMGIPTVNIPAPTEIMLPPNGVYFSRIVIEGKEYKSISNLGIKPTIEKGKAEGERKCGANDNANENKTKNKKSIETNIFDFNEDVYGKDIIVYFDHFSRPEYRFADKEELFAQIVKDCEAAQLYLI
ncbi:MAG: riboflavin biosynthesis protein RibF [Mogibacterium sp.]|nr:riboflavin biosynthesis protein RibF [Mogibacterium sp.]